MKDFYEVVVKYDRMEPDGSVKKANDKYLVNAVNCTDAEAKMTSVLTMNDQRAFEIDALKKKKFAEVIISDGEDWWAGRICYSSIDEKTGKERKSYDSILVHDNSIDGANFAINDHMQGCVEDWELVSLVKTSYVEVYDE